MNETRKYVLTIAGFDPSGGAGILADIKTFENHKVYGLAVNTANTIQTEHKFHSLQWEKPETVLKSMEVLMDEYEISVVKTGIMPSFAFLAEAVTLLRQKNSNVKIIVDPVLRSATGHDFTHDHAALKTVLKDIYLLTPNVEEALALTGTDNWLEAFKELSSYTNVLLKGGHNQEKPGVDILHSAKGLSEFKPGIRGASPKHGTGCILSAAITANLARGLELEDACRNAKRYIETVLMSNPSLLAYHVQ